MLKEDSEKSEKRHLLGAGAIAEIFGVSRKTICEWKARGAPIFFVGKKYQANYIELWDWLKINIAEA